MQQIRQVLLSTLREYVGALGGQIELRAVFPDGDFVIETLSPVGSARKQPARNRAAMTPPMKAAVRTR